MRSALFGALACVALASAGCAGRYTLLTVPAISMTEGAIDPNERSVPGPRVEARFCDGDHPIVSADAHIGLIDEAVMKAQRQSGARYLSDVVVARQEDCIVVDGTPMR